MCPFILLLGIMRSVIDSAAERFVGSSGGGKDDMPVPVTEAALRVIQDPFLFSFLLLASVTLVWNWYTRAIQL